MLKAKVALRSGAQQPPSGRSQTGRPNATVVASSKDRLPWIVAFFLIGLVVPVFIYIGPFRFSPYRFVLVAMLLPCLALWAIGRAGPWRTADFCVIGICIWSTLSFLVWHSPAIAIEPAGILTIETAGAYFLARCFIRTPGAFRGMVRLLFVLVVLMLPGAIWEATSGQNVILAIFSKIGPTLAESNPPPRWGLDRVQGPFDHPILYGVFCGSVVGMSLYVLGYGQSFVAALWRPLAAVAASVFALSSSPFTAVSAQALLIVWDRVFRSYPKRWQLLAGLFSLSYVTIDLLSNRTPFHVFASYFAFNINTAYSRINIWKWGTMNIFDNPIFGIGMNDWVRSPWMTASIDMFWIVPAIRHGIPVWIMYLVLFFSVVIGVGRRRGLGHRLSAYRAGYLVSMGGLFVCGWAVHFWNATFVLLLFLIGAGVWFMDVPDKQSKPIQPPPERGRPRTALSG